MFCKMQTTVYNLAEQKGSATMLSEPVEQNSFEFSGKWPGSYLKD